MALRKVSMERVPLPWLFRMIEGILEKKIVAIKAYMSGSNGPFSIVEFESPEDAKKIYDFCDGLEIEDTREIFDFAFVPDAKVFADPLEECLKCTDFNFKEHVDRLRDRAPAAEDYEEDEKARRPAAPDSKAKETAKSTEIKEALEAAEEVDDCEGFVFDLHDERFERMFTDPEFMLDASNKKFREQRESVVILDEVRRRYEENS